MFKVHNRALTETEVSQAYASKLANSLPVPSSFTVTVQEDGEVGSHYDTPDFYTTEVPVLELATVNLKVFDADEDPSYINYDTSDSPMLVYISRLPPASLATLYQYDGAEITSVPTAVPKTSGNYTVRVRPAWNQYSTGDEPFMNFSFYAVDGVSGESSSSAAMASVIVRPKNDPAVAYNSNETVYAARKTLLRLTGTPVEADTCSICLEALDATGKTLHTIRKCGHRFHLDCISRAVGAKCTTCPLCRSLISPGLTPCHNRFGFAPARGYSPLDLRSDIRGAAQRVDSQAAKIVDQQYATDLT